MPALLHLDDHWQSYNREELQLLVDLVSMITFICQGPDHVYLPPAALSSPGRSFGR
jgi:hypothetical protein